jgi:NAD(P)-dependent dehydrogenase (short-subunit alcohol dehydrogenase family)
MSRTGDTFIVTGGASGLGEATVRLLHKQGGNVCIADRDQKKAEALVSELGDTRLMVAQVDVTSEEEVKACVDGVVEHFGGLQGLVNCAGIAGARTTVSKRGYVCM